MNALALIIIILRLRSYEKDTKIMRIFFIKSDLRYLLTINQFLYLYLKN